MRADKAARRPTGRVSALTCVQVHVVELMVWRYRLRCDGGGAGGGGGGDGGGGGFATARRLPPPIDVRAARGADADEGTGDALRHAIRRMRLQRVKQKDRFAGKPFRVTMYARCAYTVTNASYTLKLYPLHKWGPA